MHTKAVASLYAAAMDRRRWRDAFAAIQQLVSADGVGLCVWREATHTLVDLIVSESYEPAAVQSYARHYAAIDPRQEVLGRTAPGSVIDFDRHPLAQRLQGSTFYQEFLAKIDAHHAIGIHCERHDGKSTRLKVERSSRHGPFKPIEIARLRALAPHLRNVARLHGVLPEDALDPSAGRAALDHMADGAIVADGTGRPRWLNPAAIEMLTADDGVALRDGALRAGRSFETARLLKLLVAATRAGARIGGAMLIGRPSGRRSYALLLAPLQAAWPDPAASSPRLTLILLRDPDRYASRLAEHVGEFFGLSDAEHQLAAALLQGQTLQQSVAAFGKSMPTLRTQLRGILAKTGTRNQADLLRILLSLPTLR